MTTPRSRAESTTFTDEDRTGTWRTVILSTWYFEPSHKTWVLVGFRRNRLALSQAAKSSIQRASRSTEVGASLTVDERYTWQSSAYWCTERPCSVTILLRSAVYMTKSRGPRTDPYGTPYKSSIGPAIQGCRYVIIRCVPTTQWKAFTQRTSTCYSCTRFFFSAFSCLAFSTPTVWFRFFMSCIIMNCIFDGAVFSCLAFSVPPIKLPVSFAIGILS